MTKELRQGRAFADRSRWGECLAMMKVWVYKKRWQPACRHSERERLAERNHNIFNYRHDCWFNHTAEERPPKSPLYIFLLWLPPLAHRHTDVIFVNLWIPPGPSYCVEDEEGAHSWRSRLAFLERTLWRNWILKYFDYLSYENALENLDRKRIRNILNVLWPAGLIGALAFKRRGISGH